MKLHLVCPWQAIALICAAQAVAPVCHRSVCVAVCSAACTAWAAAPVRAVSVDGRSLCVRPCTCLADTHGVSLVVGIVVKCEIVSVHRPGEQQAYHQDKGLGFQQESYAEELWTEKLHHVFALEVRVAQHTAQHTGDGDSPL